MIYNIISNNDVPVSQMHIYLKNKTGNDGGNLPELFNDLASTESVNGLYVFAIACLLTDNFSKKSSLFSNDDASILCFIQYLKGMATTVQLNHKNENKLYDKLIDTNLLGSAPTVLNLDGDLFKTHYDSNKYHSREVADQAEDSFPYWVLKIVKEIKECEEIIKPKKDVEYMLPYYIQNISSENIYIFNDKKEKIGSIPPSGIEPISEITDGIAKLLTSKSAYINIDNRCKAIKHLESLDEIKNDTKSLVLPTTPFKIKVKKKKIKTRMGINEHYYPTDIEYKSNDVITVDELYLDSYAVINNDSFIPLNSSNFVICNDLEKKLAEPTPQITDAMQTDNEVYNYTVFINLPNTIKNILGNTNISNNKDVEKVIDRLNEKLMIVPKIEDDGLVCGKFKTEREAVVLKKKILATTGYKATIITL